MLKTLAIRRSAATLASSETVRRAVLEALVQSLPPAAHVAPGLDPRAVAPLRQAFIAGGAEGVLELARSPAWVQVGVRFSSRRQARAFVSDGRLRRLVIGLLLRGEISDFFFMHKPPGMRLRLCARPPIAAAEGRLFTFLREARQAGRIAGFAPGLYDPETHQFGGDAGLAAFHRLSTADCVTLLRFWELERRGRTRADAMLFSVLAASDLVARACGDAWEQWDAWCEMRLTGRIDGTEAGLPTDLHATFAEHREVLTAAVHDRARVLRQLTSAERTLLRALGRAGARFAADLARAVRRGALSSPPRKILPFVVIFQWNRAGLAPGEQRALSYFVRHLLDPKRGPDDVSPTAAAARRRRTGGRQP